jgi:hypothetical protein
MKQRHATHSHVQSELRFHASAPPVLALFCNQRIPKGRTF